MALNFTQCPKCGTTVAEGGGFNFNAWLEAHQRVCVGALRVQSAQPAQGPVRKRRAPKAESSAPPVTPAERVATKFGETVAKEFIKHLFKK